MEKTIVNLGINDLNRRLGTNYTLNDLQMETVRKDLQKAVSYGGTALLLWGLVQILGVNAVIAGAVA